MHEVVPRDDISDRAVVPRVSESQVCLDTRNHPDPAKEKASDKAVRVSSVMLSVLLLDGGFPMVVPVLQQPAQ